MTLNADPLLCIRIPHLTALPYREQAHGSLSLKLPESRRDDPYAFDLEVITSFMPSMTSPPSPLDILVCMIQGYHYHFGDLSRIAVVSRPLAELTPHCAWICTDGCKYTGIRSPRRDRHHLRNVRAYMLLNPSVIPVAEL